MDIRKLQRAIVDGLEDVKAQDIVVFNTEHLTSMFERVIVASGTSNRQTKALAAGVRDAVKASGFPVLRTEGESNGEWIIVDCGAAVAHIMQPEIRRYYHLEEIWGDKPVKIKLGAVKGLVKASSTDDDEDDAPAPSSRGGARKTAGAAAKKSTAKKSPAKKAGAKTAAFKTASRPSAKSAALKQSAAGAPARKAAAKKAPTARSGRAEAAPRAVPVKRIAAKKPSAKAAPAAKKAPAKKAPAKKAIRRA